MDSRSGSADISDDCGELSRLRRERHRLLLRVSGGRISEVAERERRGEKERERGDVRAHRCHAASIPEASDSHVNCGMMGGVSSSRSSTPPAMG